MRVKVRHRFVKNAGLVFSVCAAAVILGAAGMWSARKVSALSLGRFFVFKASRLSVTSPSPAISGEISRLMEGKIGEAFSRADAEELASDLKKAYPSLNRVEVKRGFVRGCVSVEAVPERIVAKVRLKAPSPGAEKSLYLADNGRLLGENYGPEPDAAFETEVRAASGLAPLAAFLREFKALSSGVLSRPVRLEYPAPESASVPGGPAGKEQSCMLVLANGAAVLWGDFEFTRAKIARLNEVLSDAAARMKGPLRVDMRYFRDGKVFVSKAGDI